MHVLASSPSSALLAGSPSEFDPEAWHPELYAAHRPVYPKELFEEILAYAGLHIEPETPMATFSKRKEVLALDVGCGPGTTALALVATNAFDRVVGIDPSARMIQGAGRLVHEMRARGELPRRVHLSFIRGVVEDIRWLPDGETDLICSSNSLQWWTSLPKAYAEFRRVLKPGGAVALWSYTDAVLPDHPELSAIIRHFTTDRLAGCWVQPARQLCLDQWEVVPLPTNEPCAEESAATIAAHGHWADCRRVRFDDIPAACWPRPPSLHPSEERAPILAAQWTIDDLGGWLASTSAAISHDEAHGGDGQPPIGDALVLALQEAAPGLAHDHRFHVVFPACMILLKKAQ